MMTLHSSPHVRHAVIFKNSILFSGSPKNTSLQHSNQTLLKPVRNSTWNSATNLLHILLSASLFAGSAYYANSSIRHLTGSLTKNMTVFKDDVIRALPKKPQTSWVKSGVSGLKWLGGLAVSFFAGQHGVFGLLEGERKYNIQWRNRNSYL